MQEIETIADDPGRNISKNTYTSLLHQIRGAEVDRQNTQQDLKEIND